VLDMTRLRAGRMNLVYEPTDIHAVTRDTLRQYRGMAAAWGVELSFDFVGQPPATGTLCIDGPRLRQLLSNGITNGLKSCRKRLEQDRNAGRVPLPGRLQVRISFLPLPARHYTRRLITEWKAGASADQLAAMALLSDDGGGGQVPHGASTLSRLHTAAARVVRLGARALRLAPSAPVASVAPLLDCAPDHKPVPSPARPAVQGRLAPIAEAAGRSREDGGDPSCATPTGGVGGTSAAAPPPVMVVTGVAQRAPAAPPLSLPVLTAPDPRPSALPLHAVPSALTRSGTGASAAAGGERPLAAEPRSPQMRQLRSRVSADLLRRMDERVLQLAGGGGCDTATVRVHPMPPAPDASAPPLAAGAMPPSLDPVSEAPATHAESDDLTRGGFVGAVVVEIVDNGLGLGGGDAEQFFKPFNSRFGVGSTGLGLSICRTLAQRMGGSVWLSRARPDDPVFCPPAAPTGSVDTEADAAAPSGVPAEGPSLRASVSVGAAPALSMLASLVPGGPVTRGGRRTVGGSMGSVDGYAASVPVPVSVPAARHRSAVSPTPPPTAPSLSAPPDTDAVGVSTARACDTAASACTAPRQAQPLVSDETATGDGAPSSVNDVWSGGSSVAVHGTSGAAASPAAASSECTASSTLAVGVDAAHLPSRPPVTASGPVRLPPLRGGPLSPRGSPHPSLSPAKPTVGPQPSAEDVTAPGQLPIPGTPFPCSPEPGDASSHDAGASGRPSDACLPPAPSPMAAERSGVVAPATSSPSHGAGAVWAMVPPPAASVSDPVGHSNQASADATATAVAVSTHIAQRAASVTVPSRSRSVLAGALSSVASRLGRSATGDGRDGRTSSGESRRSPGASRPRSVRPARASVVPPAQRTGACFCFAIGVADRPSVDVAGDGDGGGTAPAAGAPGRDYGDDAHTPSRTRALINRKRSQSALRRRGAAAAAPPAVIMPAPATDRTAGGAGVGGVSSRATTGTELSLFAPSARTAPVSAPDAATVALAPVVGGAAGDSKGTVANPLAVPPHPVATGSPIPARRSVDMLPVALLAARPRVLFVDDEAVNLRTGGRLLERTGVSVVTADDGDRVQAALDGAAAQGHPVCAVLLDITMRRVNGNLAARALRTTGCRLPLIAVTGEIDAERYLADGFDAVLVKPVQRALLLATLVRHVPAGLAVLATGDAAAAGLTAGVTRPTTFPTGVTLPPGSTAAAGAAGSPLHAAHATR
jgi:CheY-like chemotaxis protein